MRALLVTLTVVEIVVFLGALVYYLVRIARKLVRISSYLARISFGVRAIESQTAPIGPGVTDVNERLETIAGALSGLADRASGDGG